MTPFQQLIVWVYAAILAIWPIRRLMLLWVRPKIPILKAGSPRVATPDPPLVSAIIPAKDEEATLADCLASVCAQTYPNLEILVVDDRSTDGTAAIAQGFAQRDRRVRLIAIAELPPGWTGKTHALHVASSEAKGDWLWFLDADTRHAPDCLAITLRYAFDQKAELFSLLPRLRCDTFWECVVQPLAGVVLIQSYPLIFVNNDRSSLAFANGQYILVHRPAYEAAGGHVAVRDRFVEDIYLAKQVKALGRPIRVAVAPEISSTRMYTSLGQIIRGWSRIFYDALGRRPWPLVGKIVEPLIFSQTFALALVAGAVLLVRGTPGPFPLWLLGMGGAHYLLSLWVLWPLYRLTVERPRAVIGYPLAGLVMDVILFRTLGMCLTGRVTWRGTAYGPAAAKVPHAPLAAEPSRDAL